VEPNTAIKLGHPVEMLGLQCCKCVDAGWTYLAEGLDLLYSAEPVECEKGFIGANAEEAAATHIQVVDRMVQRDIGDGGPCTDEANLSDGILLKVFPKSAVKREEWSLHCLHEEQPTCARGDQYLFQLLPIQHGRLLAEHMLPGCESR